MGSADRVVLGLDVSTTATKAVLVRVDGSVAGVATSEYDFDTPKHLWVEQDARQWWSAAQQAIRSVLAGSGTPGQSVEAVGISGQMHGLVLLDENGEVVRPAILWNDQRTAFECDDIREAVGRERLIAITGNDALASFTAPKLLWVRKHLPDVWAKSRHLLLPKDYVRFRLTGDYAIDASDGRNPTL